MSKPTALGWEEELFSLDIFYTDDYGNDALCIGGMEKLKSFIHKVREESKSELIEWCKSKKVNLVSKDGYYGTEENLERLLETEVAINKTLDSVISKLEEEKVC